MEDGLEFEAANRNRRLAQEGRLNVLNASFIDVSFVGNVVDRAFADKVCDKVSDKDATRRW